MSASLPFFCGQALLFPDAFTVVRLLVVAPVLEEWIMRAGLHEWLLKRTSPVLALLISATVFSVLHIRSGLTAAALVFWPGLLFGVMYQRWRDWRWCALVHSLCNAYAINACIS